MRQTTGDWRHEAACARPENAGLKFFTPNDQDRYEARALCISECPVRTECLQAALTNQEIHGIWGGIDEYELRRDLSLDFTGKPVKRARPPRCPSCKTPREDLEVLERKRNRTTVRCPVDGLTWEIRR